MVQKLKSALTKYLINHSFTWLLQETLRTLSFKLAFCRWNWYCVQFMASDAVEGTLMSVKHSFKSLRQCCLLFYTKLFPFELVLCKLYTLLTGVWGKWWHYPNSSKISSSTRRNSESFSADSHVSQQPFCKVAISLPQMTTVKPEVDFKSRVCAAVAAVKVENLLLPTTCSGDCSVAKWGPASPTQHARALLSTSPTPAAARK